MVGRYLTPDDDRSGSQMVAVLSYPLWVQRFARRKDIAGQKIELDNRSYVIVGVMPDGFQFLNPNAALWRPFGWGPGGDSATVSYIRTFARLKPGATVGQARGQLASLYRSIYQGDSRMLESVTLTAEPLHQEVTGALREPMIVLLCGVGFVLLIACANVANLLLSRAAARQTEMGIRAALGASRSRLIRQHLTESLLLSLSGCVLGALLAAAAVPALVSLIPEDFPRRGEFLLGLGLGP